MPEPLKKQLADALEQAKARKNTHDTFGFAAFMLRAILEFVKPVDESKLTEEQKGYLKEASMAMWAANQLFAELARQTDPNQN